MKRLTIAEAEEFIWQAYNCEPDNVNDGEVEAYITYVEVDTAKRDWESYCSMIPREIDPDTAAITPDKVDGADIPCVKIVIKTESHHA